MKDTLKKLQAILTPQDRKQGYILLIMILFMALFDTIGVASIFPFISVLINPEVINTNYYISKVYYAIGFSDLNTFIFFLGFIFFIILVIATIYKAITTYFLLRFTHMRNYSLSSRVVKGYLLQPYDWFLNRHSSDLANTILFEVGQVINGVLIPLMMLVAHSAVAIALLILLIIVEPIIALVMTFILGGSYSIIYFISRNYLSGIGTDRVKANQERYKIIQEAFGGIKSVKISGLETLQLQRYEKPAIRFAQTQAASQVVSQLPKFALELIVFGGMLLILLHMMSDANGMQKALPIISLYALAGYRLMPALQQIYNQLSNLRFSLPALDALHKQMIEVEMLDKKHSNYLKPIKIKHGICIENITYKYPVSDVPVLENLTLKVPVHTTVGIVGATGSGKTTIVDIILGLLRPNCGQLLIDNIKITKDNLSAWQRSIGYVPQEIYLSDSSIAANIAFGIPEDEINKSAVEYSAQIANLHEFVTNELNNGYETIVGERGVRLSGGQRQRIGIARALYHNPDVLIFDEATSALDNITERAIIDAVHNLGHCKTIIIIAHRLTTVKECDQIFLLDKGAVVDQGRYDELIKNNAQFRAMVSNNKITST